MLTSPVLFTLGYQGRTIDQVIDLLTSSTVTLLIDIRRDAYSRKPGFTGSELRRAIEAAGIEYRHVPELGIPKEKRAQANSLESTKAVLDWYEDEYLPTVDHYIRDLAKLISAEPSALMCFESEPAMCHRSRLAVVLSKTTSMQIVDL